MPSGCLTPKHAECRIPKARICPPAPKKKAAPGKQRDPPKEGYFQPPDLEEFFAMLPRGKQYLYSVGSADDAQATSLLHRMRRGKFDEMRNAGASGFRLWPTTMIRVFVGG
ncbi:hypothetical protein ACLOJK_012769 [Asimina triloba]